ncbi:cation/H(+) antiporter 15-like [Neltuma alba]|uniref:cation/H(+) antiporter 15-like n=1 Tax=Neltuma alba TaxID=207710 RepID=UPI0010A5432C|nr:cation/H(+) antiporter 15-like [Prosopis alba]
MEHNVEVRVNGTINPVDFDYNSNYEVCFHKGIVRSKFLHGVWYSDSPFHSWDFPRTFSYWAQRENQEYTVPAYPKRGLAVHGISVFHILHLHRGNENGGGVEPEKRHEDLEIRSNTPPVQFLGHVGPLLLPRSRRVFQLDTAQRVRMLLCVTTSISTFPVMSENLVELNLLTSELGQVAMSATILNEIAHWAYMAISTVIVFKLKNTFEFLFCCIAFICFCFFAIKPAMLMIARRTPDGMPLSQGYVVSIQIGVLVMAAISSLLGMSFTTGPFLVGLVMPHGSQLATTIVDRTECIMSNFLGPLFFCHIGLNIDVYALQSWGMILKIQLIIIAGFLTKFITCTLISLSYNIRLKHGIVLGLMLNFKGIIDLIIFRKLRSLKIVDDQLFAHWVFSVIGVTAIVSPLIEILYKPLTRLETLSRSRASKTIRTIQTTSRNSELLIVSCVHKEGEVRSIIALLESMNPKIENPICVYAIHLIELSGQSTPMLRRVDISKKKSLTHHSTGYIMRAFDNYARNSDEGSITLVPYMNVAPYKSMHEAVCNFAQDRSAPLIILPFHQNDPTHVGDVAVAIRKLNMNFLDHANCSVGILVDRESHLRVSSSEHMSLHIGMFFVGGPDDREALALGMRMARRENSSLVVYRFVMQNHEKEEWEEEDEEDRRMDEDLIDEFRAMNFGRRGVAYHEIEVEGTEVFERIQELEGEYDLVMVGRKHRVEVDGLEDEEVLSTLWDNADVLGVIGDMLASTEFCDGTVPVLVTQCGGSNLKSLGRKASSVAASHSSLGSTFW